ncbi:uncharacterized protein LOC126970148 isoform X3 [Leptidea sinapis]|uniref:uncharacterized protein LOC126970148 isoform X3 n=1 Tax=Leptidea sinapis TaxID=189913 RepID=UPI00212B855E|nr:uncharacterized protein LOC126970148 isoform X3 [Leptidea sinapis]
MVVGENKRTNIMDGIENTGDVRLHDHRLRLKQRFDIVRKLGQGTYGKVQLGINKKTGQEVAIKTIKKCKIETEADLVRIRREVQIMSSVRHPNIVHIYEVFENSEKMILVMEYCSGGELYDYLSQKKVLEEEEARRLFRQIATAVYYCHIHKICHRDLKLENVLLDDTGSAKIADFGLSNVFKETSLLSTFCGSPLYASPEIVKGTPYIGPEVDCWSLGVLLYTLVYGAMPFDGSNFKRLVRQISNGDYYEPKSPSSASPLIRDMLTVDPLKRADIVYICDHQWVNLGCEASCLEVAEALAAETPVRLDLLLSLAPPASTHTNSVVVPSQGGELGADESCTDLTSSTSMAVEPSNSAEKRILDLVAEGGEDAIKPSPTRTIVSAGDNKRKLELAMSASGLQRKKERVASVASVASVLPEETAPADDDEEYDQEKEQPTLKSSATITIAPAPVELTKNLTVDIKDVRRADETPEARRQPASHHTGVDTKQEAPKTDDSKTSSLVSSAADKLTSLSLAQQPAAPHPAHTPAPAPTPNKPKKLSIPGGHVGSFKEQFERRASLTAAPEVKRNLSKPVVSKIAKPKAQSEDRELTTKPTDNGTVRLQQIGIEPPLSPSESEESELNRGGVKKTESEPTHATAVDPSVLLQDARRSLQNSMAKLVEERAGEENRRRTARDIISTAIRTGKPPVPYGRSSSAGVTAVTSPPASPSAAPSKVYRTEAHHRVEDHRNRGVSVERIIPISVTSEEPAGPAPPVAAPLPRPSPRPAHPPLRRLASTESNAPSEPSPRTGEPIKKSAREFIIPIAVEGKGYVTPRQRSLEPEASSHSVPSRSRLTPRRISSLVSGGESEDEDDTHMHRLRSSRLARAESVSSGEEDEEDEGFHLLTAENLFSTLLHRVRALTQRLNGEEGPGFGQHPHSLFNNLHSNFFNRRDGWGSRDMHAPFDSMFNKSRAAPRGNSKKPGKHRTEETEKADTKLDLSDLDLSSIEFSERELRALSGLTPALSRRLQQQLLQHLPPHAARTLRRTLSLHAAAPAARTCQRTHSANDALRTDPLHETDTDTTPDDVPKSKSPEPTKQCTSDTKPSELQDTNLSEVSSASQYCTLPRLRRKSATRALSPVSPLTDVATDASKLNLPPKDLNRLRFNARSTPERSLLSKYLTPDRSISLDESSDTSILSEPSYIAAYGAPGLGGASGFRRHSLRLTGDQPRKRISRFLRSDFFETPPDESIYAKHKKEKELETQKILKEIREKKSKASDTGSKIPLDSNGIRSPLPDDETYSLPKCMSPTSSLPGKDRSRSTTPFLPILDKIKESNIDSSLLPSSQKSSQGFSHIQTVEKCHDNGLKDTKLVRPKSYPAKNLTMYDDSNKAMLSEHTTHKEHENPDLKQGQTKGSRLLRPKSYPTSSNSPEKGYINQHNAKDESNLKTVKEQGDTNAGVDSKNDIEVSFNVTLPKKKGVGGSANKTDTLGKDEINKKSCESKLVLKKYKVTDSERSQKEDKTIENKTESLVKLSDIDTKNKIVSNGTNTDAVKNINIENNESEKKVVKKKVLKKVSSKSKTDMGNNQETKPTGEKKKVSKKVKEKSPEESSKLPSVTKKKSVLQSIGHKLEKFTSSKSNSPEKSQESKLSNEAKKANRLQREHSVPVDPPTESKLIKRAITITDMPALDTQSAPQNKTTVSKVLGLFKKFEPKDKSKSSPEKCTKNLLQEDDSQIKTSSQDNELEHENDKPKRPTSLLLNGFNRKNKYSRKSSDSINANTVLESNENTSNSENEPVKVRNSLKLDFSKLPRVKKIVPSDPVIEPRIMDTSVDGGKHIPEEENSVLTDRVVKLDLNDTQSRSRSRSRSTYSNSDVKSENSADIKDKNPLSPSIFHTLRSLDSTSPEKEDVGDRIRRKSFYSRFNEKKQRRKSNLVGPGAIEYDPVARIYSQPTDTKYEVSPTSPSGCDVSPGFSIGSDLSPSTERYRSLLADLPVNTRSNRRYDGMNDKVDNYRSLDRNEFRKYPGSRSYLDYDQPLSYTQSRYSRTKSLLDSSDPTENLSLSLLREPHKYSRTNSLYSPGSYATYRPKRTCNPAIILKESEKEPSPENILDKIRQRKISISVTRKPDSVKDSLTRLTGSPKGESDSTERSEKGD